MKICPAESILSTNCLITITIIRYGQFSSFPSIKRTFLSFVLSSYRDMIGLNNDKKNTRHTILAPTIFILAMITTASTIAAPAVATTSTTMSQPVTVATDNQSVNVQIGWEPMVIEPGQDTEFTLDFQDPSSGEPISHVNYNFEIKDQNGETVQSMTDLHTHSGSDEQTVTFDTPGSFNLVTTIIGTGLDPPFDTTHSGTAQTVITVGQQLAGATGGNATNATMAAGGNATNATMAAGGNATNATAPLGAMTTGGGGAATTGGGGEEGEEGEEEAD